MADAERQAVIRKAYSKATTQLRDNHADEFHGLVTNFAAQEGVEWKPRPSARDKAKQQMDALLAEYPDLITTTQ